VRAAFAYSGVILRQLTRDRSALFFLVVLPVAIITIIGTVFGGVDQLRIGVVAPAGDPYAVALVEALEDADGVSVVRYDDLEAVRRAVRRQVVVQGVVLPDGFGDALRSEGRVEVTYVVNPTSSDWFTVRATVDGIVGETGVRATAAVVAAQLLDSTVGEQLVAVDRVDRSAPLPVEVTEVGAARVRDLSEFSLVAPQQLVLFAFVNSLGAGTALVIARRSGVLRRAFATRTSLRVLLLGILLGWFCVALLESALIMGVGTLAFGVRWGDPVAAVALALVYAATCTGAGLLLGALGRNEDRVAAIGPATGMVLGALGGCMMPLEFFPPGMLAVARLTPHYWGVTAWQALVVDGAGFGVIGVRVMVLGGFALVLVGLATVVLRRELTGGSARWPARRRRAR
jgi:ABC-2 type transport system permease protein